MNRFGGILRAFVAEEDGATMIEYALLVALIAVVVAVALVTLGTTISAKYTAVSSCVSSPTAATCV
jgi:pilus assembly protein Flp/PilA